MLKSFQRLVVKNQLDFNELKCGIQSPLMKTNFYIQSQIWIQKVAAPELPITYTFFTWYFMILRWMTDCYLLALWHVCMIFSRDGWPCRILLDSKTFSCPFAAGCGAQLFCCSSWFCLLFFFCWCALHVNYVAAVKVYLR